PYGDYMSMLKAYRRFLLQSSSKNDAVGGGDVGEDGDVVDGVDVENDVVDDIDANIKPSVRKWCKDNFLNKI
ncbi:MAG: hypothetical protein WCJ54_08995, partial [Actinomycetota bacterium]